jgi:hypothetical protein
MKFPINPQSSSTKATSIFYNDPKISSIILGNSFDNFKSTNDQVYQPKIINSFLNKVNLDFKKSSIDLTASNVFYSNENRKSLYMIDYSK